MRPSPGPERSAAACDGCKVRARRRVRVFRFVTGRLRCVVDESAEAAAELQRGDAPAARLDAIDFGRRLAAERELAGDPAAPAPNAIFDDSGNFLLYATLLGIKARQRAARPTGPS
jgi:peptidylprolyl isomerase domain and WD repeat-containing protein 1